MEEFTAHYAKGRIAAMLLGALIFVALGCWMIGLFGPPPVSARIGPVKAVVAGWVGIVFFGLCAVLLARRLFDDSAVLRIGPSGLQAAQWSDDLIPWSQITDVTTWTHQKQTMIVLHLRDPAMFPGRGMAGMLARANSKLTGGDVTISLTGSNRSPNEALSAMARYWPR